MNSDYPQFLAAKRIERAMELWSNPGDTVLSPFAGIGSEGFVALSNGRKFIGIELKASYWKQAVANCALAEAESDRDLFAIEPKTFQDIKRVMEA